MLADACNTQRVSPAGTKGLASDVFFECRCAVVHDRDNAALQSVTPRACVCMSGEGFLLLGARRSCGERARRRRGSAVLMPVILCPSCPPPFDTKTHTHPHTNHHSTSFLTFSPWAWDIAGWRVVLRRRFQPKCSDGSTPSSGRPPRLISTSTHIPHCPQIERRGGRGL